jgi:hypothetical protein
MVQLCQRLDGQTTRLFAAITEKPCWKEKNGLEQSQNAFDSCPEQADWQGEKPDQREQDEHQNGQRPAQHKQHAPGYDSQKNFHCFVAVASSVLKFIGPKHTSSVYF